MTSHSAATSLLLFLAAFERLNSSGVGGRAQVHVSTSVFVRRRDTIPSQVLQIELLGQLLVQLINPGAFLGRGLCEVCVHALSVRLRRL